MLRIFQILAILIPLAIYLSYVFAKRREAAAAGDPLPSWWQEGPGFWAILSGLVALIASMAIFAVVDGAPAGSQHVPPRYVDGELLDSTMIEPEDQDQAGPDAAGDGAPGDTGGND